MSGHELLLALVPALPLLLAIMVLFIRSGWIMLSAPLLVLWVSLTAPVGLTIELPWLLLGSHWQLDQTAQLFLLFSAVIWLISTLYVIREKPSYPSGRLYRCLFLLAMTGNMLLIIAADMVSFYLGFAMMGLASYGLILRPAQQARRAARVYLGFTLIGELALFTAMLLLFSTTESILFADLTGANVPALAVVLLLLGFGIKLALPGLHPWLPLVYTTAPIVTVAVLSGPMMKAGLLGWMRFLAPVETESMPFWGEVLLWLGMIGVFWGTVLALLQREPRAVLAYSSVTKMGFISTLFGYALMHPAQKEIILAALSLFAIHHLLIKPMLFLGLGHSPQQRFGKLQLFGFVLLALSLAAFPFSGGSGAKIELAAATSDGLMLFFILSGLATALIMLHFLSLVGKAQLSQNATVSKQWDHTLLWWGLLPIAWFAPFMPHNEMMFDSKSFMIVLVAGFIFTLVYQLFCVSTQRPAWTRAGDLYHLFRSLRFNRPFYLKQVEKQRPFFSLPFYPSPVLNETATLSLRTKGLLWLLILTILIVALVIASIGFIDLSNLKIP